VKHPSCFRQLHQRIFIYCQPHDRSTCSYCYFAVIDFIKTHFNGQNKKSRDTKSSPSIFWHYLSEKTINQLYKLSAKMAKSLLIFTFTIFVLRSNLGKYTANSCHLLLVLVMYAIKMYNCIFTVVYFITDFSAERLLNPVCGPTGFMLIDV